MSVSKKPKKANSPVDYDQLVSQIYREVIRNPRKGLNMADKGLAIARKSGLQEAVAKLTLARAHCLRESGSYSDALKNYTRAAQLFREKGMIEESWRTSIGKIDAFDQMGRYGEALILAKRTAEYYRKAGKPFWEAKILANAGNIYQHLDRYDQALKYYTKAYPVLSREKPGDGYILLFNQATTHLCSGNPRKAVELLEECLNYFQEHNLSSFLARTHYNLSYGYYLQGKYQNALKHLTEARSRLQQLKDWSFLASCYLDEADIYLRLNQVDDATAQARKAIRIFAKLKMPYDLAESNSLLGIALVRKNRVAEALPFFRHARGFFVRQKNQIKAAEIDAHLALAYLKQKKFDVAKDHLLKALEKFQGAQFYSRMLSTITTLAEIELLQRNAKAAMNWLEKASPWIARVYLPWVLLAYYQTLGRAQLQSGKAGARKSLDRAIRLIELMRSEIPAEDLRISYFQDKLLPYHLLIEQNLRATSRTNIERSFDYVERARSRALQDLLQGSLQIESGGPEWAQLTEELSSMRSDNWRRTLSISEEPKGRKDQQSEKRILHLLRQVQRSQKDQSSKLLKATQVQKLLVPGQSLISYYRIDDVLHAYLLNKQGLKVFPNLARSSDLLSSWHFFRFQLERGRTDPQNSIGACETHLASLHSHLLAPLMDHLSESQILTIIPHGWLHAFPFHALRDEEGYLVERFKFSYAPSISVYAHCLENQEADRGGSQTGPLGRKVLVLGYSDSLAPWIDHEVEEIHKIFPEAKVFSEDSASSQVLQEKALDAGIIHIASHGRFRQDQPFFSGVHLSDGWLTLPQIYQLRLQAQLVTLSGCETGTNDITVGDELLGLTRGFLFAGASSLLVSLWRVFDVSTAYFMKCFYSAVSNRLSLVDAWQDALLQTKTQYPHPYFWAPFLLIGKT